MIVVSRDSVVPDLPELAHDWFGLATWGIIGTVVLVIGAGWIWREHKATRKEVRAGNATAVAISEQVNNNHDTNMRDDLDKAVDQSAAAVEQSTAAKVTAEVAVARIEDVLTHVTYLVKEVQEQRKDFGGIREENRDDRERCHDDIVRVHNRIDRLEKRIT